jgi:putative MATE family efflux protein
VALEGRLAGLSLRRQVAALAVWPFLELVLHALVGFMDTAIAGRLDDPAALDAIGVAAYVGWLVGMLHNAVGIGAGALIARAVGGGRTTLANAALGQAVLIALAWGLITAGAIALLAPWIAAIFSLPPGTHEMAVVYLRVLAVGVTFNALMMAGNAALRSAGDTRTPFLVMALTNAVNVGASVLFVFGPKPWGGYGVAGIAAGTVVAWGVGMLLSLGVLASGKARVRLRKRRLRPHAHTARRIVRVAWPSLVENSGMWIGNALVGTIVGLLIARSGQDGLMGAHIIAIRVESLSFLPGVALGIAAATLMGQYLGAGDAEMARRATHVCWGAAVVLMGAMGLLFIALPEPIAALLAPGEAVASVREMAVPLLRIAGTIQVFFATYLVLSQALRGAGDTLGPMVITYSSTFGVRLPAAYVLGLVLDLGLTGVWIGLCGELIVRGGVYAWRFHRGAWRRIEV